MKRPFIRVLSLVLLLTFALPLRALALSVDPAFNPNAIVPDSVFSDVKTFGGAPAIQKFLESKGSVLANTSLAFIKKLHEPEDALLKKNLQDPHYNLAKPRTAAELIWDSSTNSALNAQVVLVTLNKEQGLIANQFSSEDRLQRALDHAMGFACPDSGGCDGLLSGFYFQLFGNFDSEGNRYIGAAKSLAKSFYTPAGRGPTVNGKISTVGTTIVLDNTLGGFDGVAAKQTVTLENHATAALYRYTPHVFNGNYNFWRFYTAWFRYPTGTLLKDTATNLIYIVTGNERRQIPAFVARARNISMKTIVSASPTELANYPVGALYVPPANTIVSLDGKTYLFINGIMRPASAVVLKQRNLKTSKALRITAQDVALFPMGEQLIPKNGTVLHTHSHTNTYYLIKDGFVKQFTPVTLAQHNSIETKKRAEFITDAELALYPHGSFVTPKDGTLFKNKSQIFIVNKGKRLPISSGLFLNLKFKQKDVVRLLDDETQMLPLGTAPTPTEGTYFKVKENGYLYQFKNKSVHFISPEMARIHHLKAKYTFDLATMLGWPIGEPLIK